MNFKKRIKIILFTGILIINLILRVPVASHEEGVDSFKVHVLAESISKYGYAKWIVHPASIIGFYPLSAPSGAPVFLSGISQCSGLNMELAILLHTMMLGILGIFSVYLLARELFQDDLFSFLSAFIFSVSPLFVAYTHWNATTRGMFIALLPFFIWGLLKTANTLKLKYLTLALLILALLTTVHRMFILIIPFIVLAFVFGILTVRFEIRGRPINTTYKAKLFAFVVLFIVIFAIQFIMGKGLQPPSEEYYQSSLFKGSSPAVILSNIALNYATGITPLIILLPFGLIALFLKASKEGGAERFLLITLLLAVLIISNKQYGRTFSMLFMVILVAYSLTLIARRVGKKTVCLLLILILAGNIAFTNWIYLYRRSASEETLRFEMSEHIHNLGIFIRDHCHENTITLSDNEIIGLRVSATSEKSYEFPSGPTLLICGLVKKEQMRVEILSLAQFITNLREFWKLYDWIYPGTYYDGRHRFGLERNSFDYYGISIFKYYNFSYLIESGHPLYHFLLAKRIKTNANKIYDNGFEKLWDMKNFLQEIE